MIKITGKESRMRKHPKFSNKLDTVLETIKESPRKRLFEQSGFTGDIEDLTEKNDDFREVVYTGKNTQLVLMSLNPGESIGLEEHDVDQFFRIEEGEGEVEINGEVTPIGPGSGIVVPAGSSHDVRNTGDEDLKIYSLYSPPHHKDQVVHRTKDEAKDEAESDDEHFDGETTEDL